MILSALIRKRDTGNHATAISATQLKGEVATVARIATVAVANPAKAAPPEPMTVPEEMAVRAWLAVIGEVDVSSIDEVIVNCQRDPDALQYFAKRAAAELPKCDILIDNRRTWRGTG